jgi:hypothetical protein
MSRLATIALAAVVLAMPAQLFGNGNNHAILISGIKPNDDMNPFGGPQEDQRAF